MELHHKVNLGDGMTGRWEIDIKKRRAVKLDQAKGQR